ncbi:hypothetical protein GCM10011512_20010 [Tersicoccus solisilvae]|uniref:Septum formation initiator n=1 Tax=Tersicoccus solisilvae TaxID=1882339 RepID=A0ABQ1PAY8_9MICC|nr:septum formation initiator family protein [Tersicoccus solisilvae]GGC92962.1 hypothetical protein GCM10011512_20010 [Tersicoccus solisilvae]
MSTRRPNVPRTGPASEPRRPGTGDVDAAAAPAGAGRTGAPKTGAVKAGGAKSGTAKSGSSAARPPRPVTSALPVTPRAVQQAEDTGDERSGFRLLRGLRRPGRGDRGRAETSSASTRYTVRREDGRVNYAFTEASRPAAGGSTAVRPVPAKAFSGRLLALALVLVTITILLAPSVRTYLGQRAEIGSLQQSIQDERAEQARLKDQLARWNDPAYIKQQARDRLFYVMPGETGYLVIGADSTDEVPPVATSAESDDGPQPWLDALWTSVEGASAPNRQQ